MTKLTGLVWANGKAYFFTGDSYLRYDVATDAVDDGYPRPIRDGWGAGMFDADVDAALLGPNAELAYFFRGDECLTYDVAADAVVEGPVPIAQRFPGVYESRIDAALLWPDGRTAYFFSGDSYVAYDLVDEVAPDGYPRLIADAWPGVFDRDLDAALVWDPDTIYFFRGDEYVRFDVAADTVADGYPRLVADAWRGLPFGAAAPVTAGETPVAVESPGGGRITDKRDPAPSDVVTVAGLEGKKVPLHHLAARFWEQLVAAARADGIAAPLLDPVSGYRSFEHQQRLFAAAVEKYGSEEAARKWVAKPGGSPHHSGRAIDCWLGSGIDSKNVAKQRETAVWKWLVANAERFGFYPYDAEPWHWEYNPPAS